MYSFLLGFGTGLTLAILFAPESGGAAREYIRRQTDEMKESALDMVDRGKDAMLKQVERLATVQTPGVEVYHR